MSMEYSKQESKGAYEYTKISRIYKTETLI